MQENKKYILLGAVIIGMTILFAYLFGNSMSQVNWREDYVETNKGPFGTYLSLKLLEEYFPENGVTILTEKISSVLDSAEMPANYVFVGGDMYMDSLSEAALVRFVQKGNKAFIPSKAPPIHLIRQVFDLRERITINIAPRHQPACESVEAGSRYQCQGQHRQDSGNCDDSRPEFVARVRHGI